MKITPMKIIPMIFFIKNSIILLLLLISCHSNHNQVPNKQSKDPFHEVRHGHLKSKTGQKIPVRLLFSEEEHTQGLSGVRPEAFSDSEGVLFYYNQMAPRKFWMPDTYFNLDIVFLDNNLTIVHVDKNVPAHPGRNEATIPIYRTQTIDAQYVLEVKAQNTPDSPYKDIFVVGDKFIFLGKYSLKQIKSNIRHLQ